MRIQRRASWFLQFKGIDKSGETKNQGYINRHNMNNCDQTADTIIHVAPESRFNLWKGFVLR